MHVAVVGGGVAGLAAAHRLASHGMRVTVIEHLDRLGGQVWTERASGFVIEHGAEGFHLPEEGPAPALIDELGLDGEMVWQRTARSYLLSAGGALEPLTPGDAAKLLGLNADGESGRGVATFRRGTGALVDALLAGLGRGGTMRSGTAVSRIVPRGAGWQVHTTSGAVDADAIVLALPPERLGAVAGLDAPPPPAALGSVTVTLAYRRDQVAHALDGTGFVVGGGARDAPGLKACTFASTKFPNRAPDGFALVRAFYRPGPGYDASGEPATWIRRAVADLAGPLGIDGEPVGAWPARWPHALPQVDNSYRLAIQEVVRELERHAPAVLVTGALTAPGVVSALVCGEAGGRYLIDGGTVS